jgi:bifunctional UDP-N-acetylglucosamine pyrophosphorylase/glucosamine-1-phosphate N-acetyltransferase
MQAVILAAGKGTRMQPLTLTRPKQLVEAAGKPLIEHIVSSLPEEIDEIILVIGYLGNMIIEHCGSFLLMYGDDLVDGLAIDRALKHKCCLLAYEHPDPRAFGVIEQREDGLLKTIREKPKNPASNLVSASGIVLHTDIFDYYGEWPDEGERYVTHALNRYAKHNPVHVERLSFWQPINSIEQLKEAERALERL